MFCFSMLLFSPGLVFGQIGKFMLFMTYVRIIQHCLTCTHFKVKYTPPMYGNNMLDLTYLKQILTEFGLEMAFFTFVHGIIWIIVVGLLTLFAIGVIRLVGKVTGLPVDSLLESVKTLMKQKIEQFKNQSGRQNPFSLSMLGITITARGFTGKIIFIALLGTIATTAGSLVVGLEDFNLVPGDWYDALNATNNQNG